MAIEIQKSDKAEKPCITFLYFENCIIIPCVITERKNPKNNNENSTAPTPNKAPYMIDTTGEVLFALKAIRERTGAHKENDKNRPIKKYPLLPRFLYFLAPQDAWQFFSLIKKVLYNR